MNTKQQSTKAIGTLLILAATCCQSVAQNVSWDDGGANSNWSNFLNWAPNGLIGSGNNIFIGNLANAHGDNTFVDQDFTIGNLTLSNGATVDTAESELVAANIEIGLTSRLTVREEQSGGRALRMNGLTVNNLGSFAMEGGQASIGGSVVTNLGGNFGGYGRFNFLNGLSSPSTIFTNNGTFGVGRRAGAPASERFQLDLTANDADARADMDGVNDDRIVGMQQNTTLNLGIRALDFHGTMTMSHGSIFNSDHIFQIDNGGLLQVNAGGGGSAVIEGAGLNTLTGSQVKVMDGMLTVDSDFFLINNASSLELASGAQVRFDRDATIEGDFRMFSNNVLRVNGDLTINDAVFNWDGSGNSITNVQSGGRLEINADAFDTDGHNGTINVESGDLDVFMTSGGWEMAGALNLIGTDGRANVNGSDILVTGDVNTDSGAGWITARTQFASGSSTQVEAGSDLFFTNHVTFDGGSSHTATGNGEVSFGRNIIVNGPTTISMPTGGVQLDSNNATQNLNVNENFTVNANSLVTQVGSAGTGIYTINIDNSDSTLAVNLASGNEWTLGMDGRINIDGTGTLRTSLDGSPLNVLGFINVQDNTRFGARVDLQTGGSVQVTGSNRVLFLNGGSQADPNRLEGGTFTGTGQLHSFSAGVRGHGQINNDIFFNGGSDLIAEGGTLVFNGEVLEVDYIGAATGGTLHLGQVLDTSIPRALQMSGGTVRAAAIENHGTTLGNGTIATNGFTNHNLLQASGGGQLLVTTSAAPDLDGPLENATIEALSANLVIANTLTESFDGTATAHAGQAIEFQNNWTLGLDGVVSLEGNSTNAAILRGVNASLRGAVNIEGRGRFETPAIFWETSKTVLQDSNDVLELTTGLALVRPGALITGDGYVRNMAGSDLALVAGSAVDVPIVNEGLLRIGAGLGSVDIELLELTDSSTLQFGITDGLNGLFSVSDSVTLNGELKVDLILDPELNVDDAFAFIESISGSINGTFDSLNLPSLDGNLDWLVDYSDPSTVWLRVINGSSLAGDYDGNGLVAAGDLNLVLNNWGQDGTTPPAGWVNDFPDGIISAGELNGVLNAWGNSNISAVPEPSTALPLAIAFLVGLGLRRSPITTC